MDEDGGMMLNFAAPSADAPVLSKKVKGGHWRERRKLQLSLDGKTKTPGTSVNSTLVSNLRLTYNREKKENTADGSSRDGPKRHPDREAIHKRSSEPSHGPSSKKIRFAENKGEFGGKNNSYVSSLFTSNESNAQLVPSVESTAVSAPSNAPLMDASTFSGLGINPKLDKHLTETLRFKTPTKVQRLVVPKMLHRERDLFVKAQTGSGKTLSFLLPVFHKLMLEQHKITRDSGLFAVILTPTRELANQIYSVMETLTRCCNNIVPGIVIGGEKKKSEKARLRKGVNILVATPGRLADHMENTESLNIGQLRWLILDEGDKLIELGFEETITKITEKISRNSRISETLSQWPGLPTKRVNVLCSATMQNNVKQLGSILLNNPEMISVDSVEGTIQFDEEDQLEPAQDQTAPDQLIQNVVVVPPKLRLVSLAALLKTQTAAINSSGVNSKSIVFFSCSDSVNYHFDVFTRFGYKLRKVKNAEGKLVERQFPVDEEGDESATEEIGVLTSPLLGHNTTIYKLHGSLTQAVRTSTLQAFMTSTTTKHAVLFCTDVASRGLDLPNISNVIEYDPPFNIDDHLHRIGRSARVGKEGTAHLFLLPGIEEGYVDGKLRVVHPNDANLRVVDYENILKAGFAQKEQEDDDSKKLKKTKVDPKKKDGKWDVHATTWHLDVERWLLEDTGAHNKAVQGFTSHVRAYATHLSTERNFFNIKLLHLGHLAKSFGLRETPKRLGKSVGGQTEGLSMGVPKKSKEDPRKKLLRMAKKAVNSNESEFNYA